MVATAKGQSTTVTATSPAFGHGHVVENKRIGGDAERGVGKQKSLLE